MAASASQFDALDMQVPASLAWAHPLVQEWFVQKFGTPTEPQEQGWPHILADKPTLISAPTGSGKTLAAFLICIDQLIDMVGNGTLSEIEHRRNGLALQPVLFFFNGLNDLDSIRISQGLGYFLYPFVIKIHIHICKNIDLF